MPPGYSCPNPACTHVFAADGVKGASALTCPACGTVYRFRQTTPPPPEPQHTPSPAIRPAPPPPPKLPPPVPPPIAAPIAVPVYSEPEDEAPHSDLLFTSPDMVVGIPGRGDKDGKRRRGGSILPWVVLVLVLGGLGAGGYFLYALVLKDLLQDPGARALKTKANFAFFPPGGFRSDETLLNKARANLAMTRKSGPRCHVAAYYLDYKFREPGDEELVEEAVKRLKEYFPHLEYIDPLQSGGKGRTGELGTEKALALTFKAKGADEVPFVGECLMAARRGYAYWLVMWGPEDDRDELEGIWEKLRAGFRYGEEREGWKPTARPSTDARIEGLGVTVRPATEVWQVEETPKDYDPAAEMVLRGYELALDEGGRLRREKIAGRLATVQFLALPKAADLKSAVAAAKEHVTKRLKDVNDAVKVEPMNDRGSGKPLIETDVGEFKGEVHHLDIRQAMDGKGEFGLLAVVNRPEGVLAVFCQCPAGKRGYWLPEFKEVLASVRRK